MDYIVLGGDARMLALAALLRQKGFTAKHCAEPVAEALAEARNIVVNCPPKCGITMEEILALTPSDARVWLCGPLPWDDPRAVNLWADEALQRENAVLTAEGAVCAAMRALGRSIRGLRCMVIGWGRIGSALTEILVALGAKVTVVSRRIVHRHRAISRGAEAIALDDIPIALPGAELVFNTAPSMILDADALSHADESAVLIDLASPPYGIDLRAAWRMGLRAWREPGLPGRYCPRSAAEALYRAILRGGDGHD